MPISVACPKCHTEFRVPNENAGQSGICPKCYTPTPVPQVRRSSTVAALPVAPFAWIDSVLDLAVIATYLSVGLGVVGAIIYARTVGAGLDAGAITLLACPVVIQSVLYGLASLAVIALLRVLLAMEKHLRAIADKATESART